jgi:hypothetical protein
MAAECAKKARGRFAETFVEARPGADARACITKAKSTSVWIGFCR